MAARVSVVVPIYEVAPYLDTCLESLAQQTMADLEIIVVDDGSTDAGPEIAERFVARDRRFRLVQQANAGLGAARNTGIDHATGEFLAFVDGDDVVPRHAYEVLIGALDRTGSDFASGSVRRLTWFGTMGTGFLAETFQRARFRTHITRFSDLLVDRLACNKLFRKAFWDGTGLRFPEAVVHEDIPVILRAHYLATSVDVLPETVYLWRRREGGDLSITQRRRETKALCDRVTAVDSVSRFLADRGMTEAKVLYDRSVVGNDLSYFLNVLDRASEGYRRRFLDLVNEFLDRADASVLDQPLALERLKWHLVRRRALREVLEVLRFQEEELDLTAPVRRRRSWYGDYPYRGDQRLKIPDDVYRLEDELAFVSGVNDVRWDGGRLRIEGYAYIDMIGAPRRWSQRIEVVAHKTGSDEPPLRFRTERVHRPDVTATANQALVSLDWSGFAATLDARRLWSRRRRPQGSWEIELVVRASGVARSTRNLEPAPLHAVPVAERSVDDVRLRVGLTTGGAIALRAQRRPSLVRSYFLHNDVIELGGEAGAITADEVTLLVSRHVGAATLEYPVSLDHSADPRTFRARVPIEDIVREVDVADRAAYTEQRGDGVAWDVYLVGGGRRRRLILPEGTAESTFGVDGREIALHRTRYGNLVLVERALRPVITGAEWSPAGALLLVGSFRGPPGEYDLVVRGRRGTATYTVPLRYDADAARFTAELTPASLGSVAGPRPLATGKWELLVRPRVSPRRAAVNVLLDHELLKALPVSAKVHHKSFHFGTLGYDLPVLAVERDLDDDERGGFRQRRLRTEFYPARRRRDLRDVVVYECFGGREYSDSPRGIHEELVRRDAPFEHVWVVRDGACRVPDTAVAVRKGSREYFDAFARARYMVANDHWPRWAARRPDQTWLQTWHGAPVKRHGYHLADCPPAVSEFRRVARQPRWQYVVSPGAFATPILRHAFPVDGEVFETGLPRTDVLLGRDRDGLAAEVKRRLGVSRGQRVVLYAPTYRDHLAVRDGYRLGALPDLAAVRSALGDDDVLLFRRHRLMVGGLSEDAEASVLDVSEYPDGTELLLAVDVLVTDYSSTIFDFAATGRPIVFFTPDLETYRDEIRGFSIDFEADAPGPLLRKTDEVIDALRDLEAVRAGYHERYERFVATYCALADGRASSRVVERVFHW